MKKVIERIYDSAAITIICGCLYLVANIFEESINTFVIKSIQIVILLYFVFIGVYRVIKYRKKNI